jgi:predicted DNA-binding protein (UPF0278 family)
MIWKMELCSVCLWIMKIYEILLCTAFVSEYIEHVEERVNKQLF